MILELLHKNYDMILKVLLIISIAWVSVFVAIMIDLYFGVKKAKQLGEARTSEGFRRTINKATYYYALLTFALLFDLFDVISPYLLPDPLGSMPFFTITVGLALVFTEAKSVREKAEDKFRRRVDKSFNDLIKLAKEHQDFINALMDQLKNEEKRKQDNEKM